MEVITSRVFVCFLALLGLILAIASPAVEAQSPATAPAPAPSSDGRFSSLRINLNLSFWLFFLSGMITEFVLLFRNINRPRDRVLAHAGGSASYIPHPPTRRIFLLQLLLNYFLLLLLLLNLRILRSWGWMMGLCMSV